MNMRARFRIAVFFLAVAMGPNGFPAPSDQPFLPNSTLTLEDVVAVALSHHPDIFARYGTLKAGLSRASQGSADYYPQIAFQQSWDRGNFQTFSGPAQNLITSVFTTYQSNFVATWTLEDFGKRFAVVGQGDALTGMAKAQLREARNDVIFNTAEAYFKVLQAQGQLAVNSKLDDATQKRMKLAEELVRIGEKPKLEFLNAQAAYLSSHYNYLKSEEDLQTAIAHLNSAMGVSDPPHYELKEDLTLPTFQIDLASAKALALQTRPMLLWNRWNVKYQQARVNTFKADRYPLLAANSTYGWVDSKFPPLQLTWDLGLRLTWSLFDGNKLTHQINEAIGNLQEAQGNLDSFRLKTEEAVDQSYRTYRSALERLEVAKQEAAQAAEADRFAESRYKVGLATYLEVADAQAKLALAQQHQVQAITDLRISESGLKHAIGLEQP